jgi:hypothetical protein
MSDAGRTEAAIAALYVSCWPADIERLRGMLAEVVLAAADKWDAEHRWVRIQLDSDETEVGAEDHTAAVIARLLLPAEKIALTVATAQLDRGQWPTPNVTAVCVAALARLAAVGAQGEAQ